MDRISKPKVRAKWTVGFGANSTGVPRSYETASRWDLTVGLRLGPFGGPRGELLSYERGIPVSVNYDGFSGYSSVMDSIRTKNIDGECPLCGSSTLQPRA